MPIQIPCSCGRTFAVGEGFAGREVKCTYCGASQVAPGGEGASAEKSRCPNCGQEIEPGLAACPNCNENLRRHRQELPVAQIKSVPPPRVCSSCQEVLGPADTTCPVCGASPRRVEDTYVKWEDSEGGVFARYWSTWADSQFKFDPFFARMRWEGGYGAPLKYTLFLFVQMVGLFCLCGVPFLGLMASDNNNGDASIGAGVIMGMALAYLVGGLLWQIVATFVSAFFFQLSAQLFGGKGNYETTFRGVCYSSGSQVWSLVPYIGGLAGAVFFVIGMTHALHHGHGLSKEKACFAVLLPMLLCCGILVGGIVVVVFAAGGGEMPAPR